MKISNLLLAGLAVFGLAACSSDDSIPTGQENAKYDTYLKIDLQSPDMDKALSRTTGEVAPDTDGSDVSNLHVYLVQDGKVAVEAITATATGGKSAKVSVPTGTYDLFVVANPSETTPIAVGQNIDKLITGVTHEDAKGGFKGGSFMMATAFNGTDFTQAGTSITITKQHTENNPYSATVKVDRSAVKIHNMTEKTTIKADSDITKIVDSEGNAFFGADNELKIEGLALINGNENFNLIQKWTAITAAAPALSGTYGITPQGTITEGENMKGYYNAVSSFVKHPELIIAPDAPAFVKANTVFTTENVPTFEQKETLTSGRANTTGVIYKMSITGSTDTFYYYEGVIYKNLKDVNALDAFKGETNWFTKEGEGEEAIEKQEITSGQLRNKGIRVYEDGIMYYTYFIKDQNYKVNYKGADTRYNAVYRNSVYNLEVNPVAHIGDDIPDGGTVTPDNPNPPIDPDEMFLDVTVTVNPWILNTIGIDF